MDPIQRSFLAAGGAVLASLAATGKWREHNLCSWDLFEKFRLGSCGREEESQASTLVIV